MRFFLALGAIVFVGCGGDDGAVTTATDTGSDAATDSSTADGGADTALDTGLADTTVADTTIDASTDSTAKDTGATDTGATDTGTVKDTGGGCTTACDCSPGLGCVSGKCISGFVPVYCCEGATCPAGQQCQHGADGTMSKCP